MESKDLVNIIYFIIAISWFFISIFYKDKKNKKQTQTKKQPKPTIFDEVLEDFKKVLEEDSSNLPKTNKEEVKNQQPKLYENDIPEEVLAAQKRIEERKKSIKNIRKDKKEQHEDTGTLLNIGTIQHEDLQKMVIFTEIFKRPNF
jgi:hypothetical protein